MELMIVFSAVLLAGLALSLYYQQHTNQRQRAEMASYRLLGSELPELPDGATARREPPRAPSWPTNPMIRWASDLIGQAGLDFPPLALLVAQVILFVGGTTLAARWLHGAVAAGIGLAAAFAPVLLLKTIGRRRL